MTKYLVICLLFALAISLQADARVFSAGGTPPTQFVALATGNGVALATGNGVALGN
jgi:hypothetical protein